MIYSHFHAVILENVIFVVLSSSLSNDKKVVVGRSINQEKRDVDEKCAWMLGKNERMATDNFRSNIFRLI